MINRHAPTAILVFLFCTAGCAGTDWLTWPTSEIRYADPQDPAVEVVALWEPAEGRGLDGRPTRGFAGQILFFTRGDPSPVAVEGDVRIALYDGREIPAEQKKPIHQFDFLGKAWTAHLQKGMLGPSYHVFIPYVRKDPYQVKCGLQVRLAPKQGPTIYSKITYVTLPGPTPEDETGQAAVSGRQSGDSPSRPDQPEFGASLNTYRGSPARLPAGTREEPTQSPGGSPDRRRERKPGLGTNRQDARRRQANRPNRPEGYATPPRETPEPPLSLEGFSQGQTSHERGDLGGLALNKPGKPSPETGRSGRPVESIGRILQASGTQRGGPRRETSDTGPKPSRPVLQLGSSTGDDRSRTTGRTRRNGPKDAGRPEALSRLLSGSALRRRRRETAETPEFVQPNVPDPVRETPAGEETDPGRRFRLTPASPTNETADERPSRSRESPAGGGDSQQPGHPLSGKSGGHPLAQP